jgi:tetratricopeptide (TPR) repeat protein
MLISVEYRVSIEDLASLAIVTFKIPDLSDAKKKAMLAPSIHKPLAGHMLQGCAQQKDPLAIMQILTAVYLAGSSDGATYKDLASLFPSSDIATYRKTLEELGAKSKTFALGPEVLTLQGLFLEREGKRDKAEALYIEAVERCHFKYNPKTRHPMQIELLTPWNALAYFYKNDPSLARQAQAKAYFEKGALEGDDPLSCYELACLEDKSDPGWLTFTSKAAASGHRQAAVDLADFYQEASAPDPLVLANSKTRNMLNWLTGWRKGSTATLAQEWLRAASIMGHKPSTLKLAEHYQSKGDKEGAKEYWQKLTEPPSAANQVEEWPQLVHIGRKRLASIKA